MHGHELEVVEAEPDDGVVGPLTGMAAARPDDEAERLIGLHGTPEVRDANDGMVESHRVPPVARYHMIIRQLRRRR